MTTANEVKRVIAALTDAWGPDQDAIALIRSLAKDASRYQWLAQRLCVTPQESLSGSIREALDIKIGRAFVDSRDRPHEDTSALDAAIDSAMARKEGS